MRSSEKVVEKGSSFQTTWRSLFGGLHASSEAWPRLQHCHIPVGVRHWNQGPCFYSGHDTTCTSERCAILFAWFFILAVPANLPFCFPLADCSRGCCSLGDLSNVMPVRVMAMHIEPISAHSDRIPLA